MAYEDEEDLNYDDYEDEEYPQNHRKNYNYDDDDYEYDDDSNDDFYEMEIKNEQNP